MSVSFLPGHLVRQLQSVIFCAPTGKLERNSKSTNLYQFHANFSVVSPGGSILPQFNHV